MQIKRKLGILKRRLNSKVILKRDTKKMDKWNVNSQFSQLQGKDDMRNILIQSHVVEKGLSHKNSKPLFGLSRVKTIATSLDSYLQKGGTDKFIIGLAVSALEKYNHYNRDLGVTEDQLIEIPEVTVPYDYIDVGSNEMTKKEFFHGSDASFIDLSKARHSMRLFDCKSEPINCDFLVKCIEIAQNCPSACNMQSVRVKIVTDKSKIEQITSVQGGSSGFGENSGAMLLITADVSMYNVYEYKMAMVDCGIFIMNLVYALYTNHLGSCILNGNLKGEGDDDKLKAIVPIPEGEILSAVISVSNMPDLETIKITCSSKRRVSDIVEFV